MDKVYKQNRAFFGEPYLLTPEQQKEPLIVFHSFFDSMALEEARACLHELQQAALTCTMIEFSTPQGREDAMYVCRKLEELVEAAWLVKGEASKQ